MTFAIPNFRFLCVCALLAAAGCRQQQQSALPPKEIARVGEAAISREAFQTLLDMRARGASNRYASLSAKEELLDELVRREAILAKAKADGFDQRPDIQESVKRLIASKFQEEQMKQKNAAEPVISQQEIEQYYKDHADKYATPAKVRGAILFLKISPLADAQRREQGMAKAQSLLDQAKAASPADFARLVAANSEDQPTRYRAGDMGWVSREAKGGALRPAVMEALFSLRKPGDFAPLVPAKEGVYIVKLLEAQPAGARPLTTVKDAIAYTLRKQKLDQREQDFYAAMKAGLDIHINREMLAAIEPPAAPDTLPPATPGAVAQK